MSSTFFNCNTILKHLKRTIIPAVLVCSYLSLVGQSTDSSIGQLEAIRCDVRMEPPTWALLERHLKPLLSVKLCNKSINLFAAGINS